MDHSQIRQHRRRNGLQTLLLVTGMALLCAAVAWMLGGMPFAVAAVFAVGVGYLFNPALSPAVLVRLYGAREVGSREAPELIQLATRAQVALLEMALFGHAAADQDAVYASLDRIPHKEGADPAGARHLDPLDVRRQLAIHPLPVCRRKEAVLALKDDDPGDPGFAHAVYLFYLTKDAPLVEASGDIAHPATTPRSRLVSHRTRLDLGAAPQSS